MLETCSTLTPHPVLFSHPPLFGSLCGAIPCCPFPNPFKSVQQGSVGLVSRFGQFYKCEWRQAPARVCLPHLADPSSGLD